MKFDLFNRKKVKELEGNIKFLNEQVSVLESENKELRYKVNSNLNSAKIEVVHRLRNTRLCQIVDCFDRRVGNTEAEINGVKNTKEAILIVANENQKKVIDLLLKEQVVSINELLRDKSFRHRPIVIDHYALEVMVNEIFDYLFIEELDEKYTTKKIREKMYINELMNIPINLVMPNNGENKGEKE